MSKPRSPRSSGPRTTSWERRLRDMLLAGGALAIAGGPGCTTDDSTSSGVDAGSDVSAFCCNANSDPCCKFEHCGAPMSAACACSLDGGTSTTQGGCIFGDADVSDEDAAISDDAGTDADADVSD